MDHLERKQVLFQLELETVAFHQLLHVTVVEIVYVVVALLEVLAEIVFSFVDNDLAVPLIAAEDELEVLLFHLQIVAEAVCFVSSLLEFLAEAAFQLVGVDLVESHYIM